MSEKLCLQWNDFKDNAISAFGGLREDLDFADVTLACEDGKQVEVHKVILASSSPFFKNLMRRNKHSHPLIYMRGVNSDDLLSIIDFLYCGEANVYQENLDSFLAIAEELQLKGLMGKANDDQVLQKNALEMPFTKKENPVHKKERRVLKSSTMFHSDFDEQTFGKEDLAGGGTISLAAPFSEDLQELDRSTTSMMEKTSRKNATGHPFYRCKECGHEAISGHMKTHIEAKHLEGVSIPCNFCEKTFRCRSSQMVHNNVKHKIKS